MAQTTSDGKVLQAQTNAASSSAFPLPPFAWKPPTLSSWWNGPSGTANWFGLGAPLNDYGLTVSGKLKDVYFGLASGGLPNQPRSNFIEEIKMSFLYDFSKLFGLDGLSVVSNWRYRNVASNNPGYAAGSAGVTSGWNPTDMSSGFGMRMMSQMVQYTTPDKVFTINGGLENPYDQFLQQPLSKEFQNNMINSSKGIGATQGPGIPYGANYSTKTANNTRLYGAPAVGWSSSYLAWGGTVNVKPVQNVYLQSGLYEAVAGDTGISPTEYSVTSVYPYTSVPQSYLGTMKYNGQTYQVVNASGQQTATVKSIGFVAGYQNNHGFTTSGAPAFTPVPTNTVNPGGVGGNYSGNGLFNVTEIGWTPKFGPDKLEGRYAIGGYIWGLPNDSYSPTAYQYAYVNKVGQVAIANSTKAYPTTYNGLAWGLYLQADQMLFRHHDADAIIPSDGKNPVEDKNPIAPTPHTFSDRGLYMFNEFSFTPPQNNAMPLYFQTGLVYKGLFDVRPKDSIGIVLGAGFYSSYLNSWTQSQNQALKEANGNLSASNIVPNGPTTVHGTSYYQYLPYYSSTQVIEAYYAIQLNKWAFFKPYAQCLVNPAGNGTVATDWTLGAQLNVTF
jgi:hypothetical protein